MMWKKLLQWVFIGLVFVFLGHFLWTSWGELQGYEFSVDLWLLALAVLCAVFHFIFIAVGWGLLLRRLHRPGLTLSQAVRVRTVSDFGRFIPGKVWLVVGRVQMAAKYGIPKDVSAFSTLLEIYVNILSTLILFVLVFLVYTHSVLSWYALYILAFLPVPIFLLHRRFFNKSMKLLAKVLKRVFVRSKIPFHYMLSLLSVFLVAWVVLGLGFFLLVAAVYPVSWSLLFPLTGIFALAWALGFVMIFLPAGLGFREAVLSYLLSFFLPLPIAILVALLSRIWLVGAEILTAGLFLARR